MCELGYIQSRFQNYLQSTIVGFVGPVANYRSSLNNKISKIRKTYRTSGASVCVIHLQKFGLDMRQAMLRAVVLVRFAPPLSYVAATLRLKGAVVRSFGFFCHLLYAISVAIDGKKKLTLQ